MDNIETDTREPFTPPEQKMSFADMLKLGHIIKELVLFHFQQRQAEIYFFSANSSKHKSYYDWLAKRYASQLKFKIINNLGYEGFDYEIQTSIYPKT